MRTIQFKGNTFHFPIAIYYDAKNYIGIILWGIPLISGYVTIDFFLENKMDGVSTFLPIFIFSVVLNIALNYAFSKPIFTIYPDKIISHQVFKDKELFWRDCELLVTKEKRRHYEYLCLHFLDKRKPEKSQNLFLVDLETMRFEKEDFGVDGNLLFFIQLRERGIK